MSPKAEMKSQVALGVGLAFFDFLEKEGIDCCHWKSNQHLPEALCGKTDLDVLVGEKDSASCEKILRELNFKKMISAPSGRYPGIEDWLGFDPSTGGLLHIHLHYALIVGDDRLKNYLLPIGVWLLKDCRKQEGVSTPHYEKELIILILRIILKADYKTLTRPLYKRRKFPFPDSVRVELDWLLERYNPEDLSGALGASGLNLKAETFLAFIRRYEEGRLTGFALWQIKISIGPNLKPYRRYSGWAYWRRQLLAHAKTSRLARRFRKKRKKALASKSLYFALVGSDGSGKTRLAEDLKHWLRWKLEARHLYFGIPKKSFRSKLWSRPLSLCASLRKRSERLRLSGLARFWDRCHGMINARRWVSLAEQRLELHRHARELAAQGTVVIAERFPLRQFASMKEPMDGPRIPEQGSRSTRRLAAKERDLYEKIELPDQIYVLQVSLDELRRRKNDLGLDTHREKAEAVNALKEDERFRLINAEAAYEEVLLEIKNRIWQAL
jgi:hypothetical protein